MNNAKQKWDVFISHASEDKDAFVRALAKALGALGVHVWYDEFSLRIGDSLRRSIDKGIAGCRYGIVVISPHFIAKAWSEYELSGLVSREIAEDTVILPIWHGVSKAEVLEFSPSLADKFALKAENTDATDMAIQILRVVRPDLYAKHPRAYLERVASGEAVNDLQEQIESAREELEATREELAQFKCPYCGSDLITRDDAPTDSTHDDWETVEMFACGYHTFAGVIQRPCPCDPRFPKFEDFELKFTESSTDHSSFRWQCAPIGKTEMARSLHLRIGHGSTREEAELAVREDYEWRAGKA